MFSRFGIFLGILLTFGSTLALADEQPNIILLLADDLGYQDLSSFDSTAVETPNIDQLATEGMKLTQFYAASAVCTPTRASILTGKYPLRFDIRRHFPDDESHLPAGTVTLPKLLKEAGYQTAHVGKWHLGGLHLKHLNNRDQSIPGPHQHGFDHYLCQNEEQPLRSVMGRERRLFRDGGTCLIRDEVPVPESDPYFDQHFTDINGDETVRLIKEFAKSDRPFFLNLWWLVPHKPYEPAPEPHWKNTEADDISDDQHRFRSMITHMDAKVGQIMATLEELGIRENTLVVFTSDNGAAFEGQIGNLKGGKTDLHEGGIRVPMIASWPKQIPAAQVSRMLGHTTDLLPTFCAAAGVELPADAAFDGMNILPYLKSGELISEEDRGVLHWQLDLYPRIQRHYPKPKPYSTEVVRFGPWKMLSREGEPQELFHVDIDPEEKNNLLSAKPEIVEQLTQEVQQFLAAPRHSWKQDTERSAN
ncbi:N-acetylgalactosamine-6-sulfatase [Planctomycetales bacterium 10988]|nr:N-acetylgalactosamine-6-sulfatase [Planctomycetales bacterium 10988]